MITETTIERVLDRLESGVDAFEQEIADFSEAQPHLMAYLVNEENDIFNEAELEQLLFAALVIYQSITDQRLEPAQAPPDLIEQAEEQNYQIINGVKGNFRAKLDPFFDTTKEEDLLAFIEDLLTVEAGEDGAVTKEAREPLFVTLKTVVDVLT